jgi:hypothetical protein
MPINYQLMALKISAKYSYGDREVMLYAYGIGLGADPMDEKGSLSSMKAHDPAPPEGGADLRLRRGLGRRSAR